MNKDNKIEMIQLFDAKHPLVSKASLLEAFGYKIVSVDFVTFPEPVEITVWADICDCEPQAPKLPQGEPQIQEAATTPSEDPFAAEDKFEPHRGYYGYSVKTFKNPSPQEIIEWNLLSPPWVHEARSTTARKNRFKRLRLVKRKIDERN